MGSVIEADHATGTWIFSKEVIEKETPSRKDGIDAKKEAWLRKGCCTFIQDAGMRLKVPQLTIATAIMFCHRFFMRQSYAQQDRYVIASTCLFLAGKVEDTPRQLKDVIYITYIIRHKKDKGAEERIKQSREIFEHERELLLSGEYLVMNTLSFDLNINHPYKPLLSTIRKIDKEAPQKHLAQVAWNFVNDGLRTSLGLQFKPHELAAGAIYLAAKFLKYNVPNQQGKPWWTEFEVTPNVLEDVSSQMLELYEQTNKDGSGTTGASSRRAFKGHPPTKAASSAKSKGAHPTTPSVGDRAAQVSLTSGATALQAAGPTQLVGGTQLQSAGDGVTLKEVVVQSAPASAPPAPMRLASAAPGGVGGAGAMKQEQTEEVQRGSAGVEEERGPIAEAPAASMLTELMGTVGAEESRPRLLDQKESTAGGGGKLEDAGQVAGAVVRGLATGIRMVDAAVSGVGVRGGQWGAGLASLEADKPQEGTAGYPGRDAGGKALDEPMDMDEGPTPPSRGPASVDLPASQAEVPPLRAPERLGNGDVEQGPAAEVRPALDGGEDRGRSQGTGGTPLQQERVRENDLVTGGPEGRLQDGGVQKAEVGGTREGAEPTAAAEDGEIPSEEGEIPSSPVSRDARSPSKGSREQARSSERGRSRSRSGSRDRSRSPGTKRRRLGHHSRSESPKETSRGRSRSPHRSGEKRHLTGQRRKDHHQSKAASGYRGRDAGERERWDRDRDHDRSRDRDRNRGWDKERDRDRARERPRPHYNGGSRHGGPRYNDNSERSKR